MEQKLITQEQLSNLLEDVTISKQEIKDFKKDYEIGVINEFLESEDKTREVN